jgi:hypothetical protein
MDALYLARVKTEVSEDGRLVDKLVARHYICTRSTSAVVQRLVEHCNGSTAPLTVKVEG